VIIVNGGQARLDSETATLIAALGATKVVIAGGPSAVSDGIQGDIQAIPGVTVVRQSGADRYATSAAINAGAFPTASHVYLASGAQFPDALAGAVRAGIDHAPLYLVPGSCVPSAVANGINSYGPVSVTLLGGATALPLNLASAPAC
jgi:putative cell wall-binding protein